VTIIYSCETKSNDHAFRSDFNTSESRTWVGPEYWSNPIQDWQVSNGELECLVSKPNRNVHVLTKKLNSATGDFSMQVDLRLLNSEVAIKGANWVGFSIGSKGEFNDFRDNAIFGKGLNAGVTTSGNLFIESLPNETVEIEEVKSAIKKGSTLKLVVSPNGDVYSLTLSIIDVTTKSIISEISKDSILAEQMVGDLVLMSNFKSKNPNKKSVAFKNWKFSGSKIETHNDYAFGPIMFSQYTLSRGKLKLTAQMAPVILNNEKVQLQTNTNGNWETIADTIIDEDARTATFSIENWDVTKDISYRLSYAIDKGKQEEKEEFYWIGTIRKDPTDKDELVVAGFTGNDQLGFPNTDITERVKKQNPDVLFFSGDQIYEPNGGFGAQRSPVDKATLDYLRKWYMYGWAYRDLLKGRPTVSITDDHDVYHGNIWGENGRDIPDSLGQGSKAQDFGGYKMPPRWVKMVERTQTSHLPDPFDPTSVEQGIGTYYTDMVYGGVSFAILEDRKFKSAPKHILPEARIFNGWAQNRSFSMKKHGDVPGAKMLGDRQLLFLNEWVSDWSYQSEMKMLLSATIFANVATLPKKDMFSDNIVPNLRILHKGEYAPDDLPVSDLDSNGWPQTGRNKAVSIIRKGFTFHLAGDQHLGSAIQYGIDDLNDAGFAFCVPSISNHWPRRWYPSYEGIDRNPEMPKYTGGFEDGFGNKMTVHAVSNPVFTGEKPSRLYDRATGYGIVKLNKNSRNITFECWPRNANLDLGDAEQYPGWPITVSQEDNFGKKAQAYLPKITIVGLAKPVIKIINEKTVELVYSLRINENNFSAKVFDAAATYTVQVGEPDTNTWVTKRNVVPNKEGTLSFKF
ncbi:alkaline phosphatase D family protein, partial [Bacteroidota bacterium]